VGESGRPKILLEFIFKFPDILAAPATSSATDGVLFTPTHPVVVNAVAVVELPVEAIFAPPNTSSAAIGVALFTPTHPVVVNAVLVDAPPTETIFAAPETSNATVGAATFTPTRPVVVNAVAVVELPVEAIFAAPETSNATVGAATFTPTRPVVINAVPVAAVDIIRAAATDAAPLTSSLTPGTTVPIPTFPSPFTNIRSTPAVLILTELLNFAPLFVSLLKPMRSIQLLFGAWAVRRKNPVSLVWTTPRISFTLTPMFGNGRSASLAMVPDTNLIRGLSVKVPDTELDMCIIPDISTFGVIPACAATAPKLLFIHTGPFRFARPVTDTSPAELITIELLWVAPTPVWNVIKSGDVIPRPADGFAIVFVVPPSAVCVGASATLR
jgi:hypothetical protein